MTPGARPSSSMQPFNCRLLRQRWGSGDSGAEGRDRWQDDFKTGRAFSHWALNTFSLSAARRKLHYATACNSEGGSTPLKWTLPFTCSWTSSDSRHYVVECNREGLSNATWGHKWSLPCWWIYTLFWKRYESPSLLWCRLTIAGMAISAHPSFLFLIKFKESRRSTKQRNPRWKKQIKPSKPSFTSSLFKH